jgi:hypothetical protein
MNNNVINSFLGLYFKIFQAEIESIKIGESEVNGTVIWEEENERQDFSWAIEDNQTIVEKASELIAYMIKNSLTTGDKIKIEREALEELLVNQNWMKMDIDNSIDFICSIRIAMIDEGEIVDYFLMHF